MDVKVLRVHIRDQVLGQGIFFVEAFFAVFAHRCDSNHVEATAEDTGKRNGKPRVSDIFFVVTSGATFYDNIRLHGSSKKDTVVFCLLKRYSHYMKIIELSIARIRNKAGV